MAFEGLQGRLQDAFSSLRRKDRVTEEDVNQVMREVRLALLEADVNFKVVKDFIKNVRGKAMGEDVLQGLNPGQQVIKIVNDELKALMGGELEELNLSTTDEPTVFMMTGLQGTGKTTTTGKLANYLRKNEKLNPLLVAGDVYRPAAIDQLKTVGKQLDIPVFEMGDQVSPVEIAKRGLAKAKEDGHDLVIIDTAGRLHVDEALMDELVGIKEAVQPDEIFLIVDAMTGQDAVNVAESFDDVLDITSIILTKLDGDTRGGAALSITSVTGKPIKFAGSGEKLSDIEPFHPDRMANRILGMGDILTLIERAQEEVDEQEAEALAQKMRDETYDFNDFISQMNQVRNMGPLTDIIKMIPGLNKLPGLDELDMDEGQMDRVEAIVLSMTPAEREDPNLLSQKRRQRIAAGAGRPIAEVNGLITQFKQSREMMSSITKGKAPKMPNMPNMPNMPKGLGGLGKKGKKGKGLFGGLDLPGMDDFDMSSLGLPDDTPKNRPNRKKKKKKIVKRRKK